MTSAAAAPPTSSGTGNGRLRIAFLVAATLLGILQYGAHLQTMYPDGISYLEIAQSYLDGRWREALNSYWSPLYSWLIAAGLAFFRPSPQWEFVVVHGVGLATYLAALAGFDFLFERLLADLVPSSSISMRVWRIFGYALFLWAAIGLLPPALTTPDMLVAALVFLAAGLLIRARQSAPSSGLFVALGAVLGLGYLAKAVMLPLSFVILGVTLWTARARGRTWVLGGAALAVFLSIVLPFAAAVSWSQGRFTVGRSGPLNYAWYVSGADGHIHWQGDATMPAAHPTRLLSERPRVMEYGEPVAGTYPPWYDPSYWNEGLRPTLDVADQLRTLLRNLGTHERLLRPFLLAIVALVYGVGWRRAWRALSDHADLIVIACAGVGIYLLIRVEARFLIAFHPLLLIGLFGGLRRSCGPRNRLADGLLVALSVFALATVATELGKSIQRAASASENVHWEVARAVRGAGVGEGTKVAVVGSGFDAYWAHLAGAKIVAEVARSDVSLFWEDPEARRRALKTLGLTDAELLIARSVPPQVGLEGWRELPGGYRYLRLEATVRPGHR